MMAAGVALLTFWALLRLRQKRSQRDSGPPRGSEQPRTPRQRLRDADREAIDSLMVDAEELTRRLAAHMENKAARLERLLAEADERIARLEQAQAASEESREGANAGARRISESRGGGHHARARSAPAPAVADPLSRDVYRLADEGLEPLQIAQRLSEQVGKVQLILALRDP